MMLAGKKIVVVGGSSGIGLATAELAKREGADVTIASRNAERLKAAAEKIGVIAIPADVTSDDSVSDLFRKCGPVDHVVVTAAQLRTGPFKTVSMDDVRATMESKFWGAWRVARAAEIRPGGSLTLVTGYLSTRPRPGAAIVGAVNGALESLHAWPGARARADQGQCGVARHHRYAYTRQHAGGCAPRHAHQDGRRVARWPGGRWRRYCPANPDFYDGRLCDRIDRLYRRRRIGRLTLRWITFRRIRLHWVGNGQSETGEGRCHATRPMFLMASSRRCCCRSRTTCRSTKRISASICATWLRSKAFPPSPSTPIRPRSPPAPSTSRSACSISRRTRSAAVCR